MSPTWLDNLERSLEERLEQFLSSNPSQDQLLREQHLQDRQRDLHNRRGQQQLQARELRRQLLTLAEQVQAWTKRGEKARKAGALELAQRADQHVVGLMQQGRELWEEFEALGLQFAELEEQLNYVKDDVIQMLELLSACKRRKTNILTDTLGALRKEEVKKEMTEASSQLHTLERLRVS